MTDLERKLADALRTETSKVTPNLDAAWAEQLRRQHRPRRRRAAVWIAPLAAVLVVLTSVSIATQVNTVQPPPAPAARPGQDLVLAAPLISPSGLVFSGEPKALTDFAGQTDAWTSYATDAAGFGGLRLLCVEALPKNATHGGPKSNFGIESPSCVPTSGYPVKAGYIGKNGGPLPEGKAVFLVDRVVRELRFYDSAGDLTQARALDVLGAGRLFLADVEPGSPPVRFEINWTPEAQPASR
ncbi:hypothetical protein [Amycolatopsis solani]|uniref:hypothetical protein n=1 Tax=Amycolatopsis solani TaxID=3028615 RepID=UPI0025B02765|nr:hypothetical protein [Amycolatopsis sp. MEP2-6]